MILLKLAISINFFLCLEIALLTAGTLTRSVRKAIVVLASAALVSLFD